MLQLGSACDWFTAQWECKAIPALLYSSLAQLYYRYTPVIVDAAVFLVLLLFSDRSSITRLSYDDKILRTKDATVKETIQEEKVSNILLVYLCCSPPWPRYPLRERPVRDVLVLISPFSSVHSLSCGLHWERSQFLGAKKGDLWFTFNVRRYSFQLSITLTEEFLLSSRLPWFTLRFSGSAEFLVALWPSSQYYNMCNNLAWKTKMM